VTRMSVPAGVFSSVGDDRYDYCFAAGTRILLADHPPRNIEAMEEQLRLPAVLDTDPEGKPALCHVLQVFRNAPAPIWHVQVAGDVIRTTANHPFYARSKGWVAAAKLQPGDELRTFDGGWIAVESVEDSGVVEPVFNLHVEGNRTYFVQLPGGPAVLVHNNSFTDYVSDIGSVWKGYGEAAVGVVTGVGHVIAHPVNTVEGVSHAVAHPIATGKALAHGVAADWNSGPEGQGKIVGGVLIAVGSAGAGMAGKGAQTVDGLATAGNAGKLLEEAEAAAKAASDAEAAAQAAKAAKDAEAAANAANEAKAAEGALNNLGRPAWANTPGGFMNWLKNLSGTGTKLTAEQADALINEAQRLGVDVRLDPPHPGTNWEVPHLNIGSEGQVHIEVPGGYDNPSVPKGSVTKPR
jgi:Pretoxin HINT domain